jgi:hypothetical protein
LIAGITGASQFKAAESVDLVGVADACQRHRLQFRMDQLFGLVGLEFHRVRAALHRCLDKPVGRVGVAVVIAADLRDDENVAIGIAAADNHETFLS